MSFITDTFNTSIRYKPFESSRINILGFSNTIESQLTKSSSNTGPRGLPGTAMTGSTGTIGSSMVITGPVGPDSSNSLTGSIGPDGVSSLNSGIVGPAGPTATSSLLTGPTGSVLNIAGTTGPSVNSSNIIGPTGPPGLTTGTGPTGSAGQNGPSVLPNPLLTASVAISDQSVPPNTPIPVGGILSFDTSSYYLIWGGNFPSAASIGIPAGLWKVVFNVNWSGGTSGYRQLNIVDPNSGQNIGQNIAAFASSDMSQEVTWIGYTDDGATNGMTLNFEAQHNDPSSLEINGGFISLYSYTQGIATGYTAAPGPVTPGQYQFVARFINHDTVHPPVQLAIIYQNDASTTSFYYSPSGSYPISGNSISASGPVSQLFLFDWSAMPDSTTVANAKEIILGTDSSGSPIELNSLRFYIAKTDVRNNPLLYTLWKSNENGLAGGIPQSYLEGYTGGQMTIDFVEMTYNKPAGQYQLFTNTSQVDGMSIPMTLTLNFKVVDGNRRINFGPLGITTDMGVILSAYAQQYTGTIWSSTIVPTGTLTRLSGIQKLISPPSGSNTYYDSYVNAVWTSLNTGAGGTGVNFAGIGEATFTNCTIYTDPVQMYVSTTGGTSGYPSSVQYTIPINQVLGHSIDIFGNAGVWATSSVGGNTGAVILKTKAYLVCAMCRGVIQFQDTDTGGTSGNPPFANSVWNDWLAQGANFYINTPVFPYPKLIHNYAIVQTTSQGTRPYCYGLSFDDNFSWSSTETSNIVNDDTQVSVVNIDIYTNNNTM